MPLGPLGRPGPLFALAEEGELVPDALTGPGMPEKKLETPLDPICRSAAVCDAVTIEALLVIVQFAFIP